jgi:hypothetical protein
MSRTRQCAVAGATLTAVCCAAALASSHREAPFTSANPTIDGTDFYMFRAYGDASTNAAAAASDSVVFIANYDPLQDPYGGPNYFPLNQDALYAINVDNDGDARPEISFRFRFTNHYKNEALNTGATDAKGNPTNVAIPLIVSGQLGTSGDNSMDPSANRYGTYTLEMVRSGMVTPLTASSGSTFQMPLDNIGNKTIADYATYANSFIYQLSFGSCGNGRVFVGQRREGFIINVGEIFDLVDLNPLGDRNATQNTVAGKNITSIALQVPVACLTRDGKGSSSTADPVLGAWTTSYLRQVRVLNPAPRSTNNAELSGGAWTQVSRLGHPLVNEVVIGLPDKDRFNDSQPKDDAQFAKYVTNPTLPVLINALFPGATTVPGTPRNDLVAAFLTGLSLKASGGGAPLFSNNPSDYGDTVVPSEELRLNTAIAPVASTAQNNLGLLACDTSGYPNGRRPADDVVDIELTVAEGAIYPGNPNRLQTCDVSSGTPTIVNAGAVVNDGAAADATDSNYYLATFPYLAAPLPGAPNSARAAAGSAPTSTGTAAGGDNR